MSIVPALPPPKSALNVYRVMSKTASVRVSPLCFGAMNIGESWAGMMGAVDKKSSYDLLDYFYSQGGNFIDTASLYQNGESEIWLGEWMAERGIRDEIVLATKYSSGTNTKATLRPNDVGNSRKSMHISLENSLKRLQTDYIDIFYVHWWDYTTSIEEIMLALDALVRSGKVLYLGISDTPAWIVAKANQYARDHGLSQFVIYQGRWSVADRDMEREIIPMCKHENMALHIFGSLGSGRFKTQPQIDEMAKAGDKGRLITEGTRFGQTDNDRAAVAVLDEVARETGSSITSVALAWVLHREPYVFPIVGGRKIEHLKENVDALTLVLSEDQINRLNKAVPLHLGFPYAGFGMHPKDNFLVQSSGHYQWQEEQKPIPPFSKDKLVNVPQPSKQ
eukprot:TRINITY_DN4386_c0_g2_i4.p1 TRINITY_DN4386_c0_g2~~TRINITY_DN4386_c0_g2_i4.p1  ORF type:complete len:392 (-),score=77.86 TRINITY_DN4386_c0_g2_i4:64-1239(-)